MVKLPRTSRRTRAASCVLVGLLASATLAACIGRIESTRRSLVPPYHAAVDTLREFVPASITPPTPVTVRADVAFTPFVAYYPLPMGFFIKDAAYNEAGKWVPITVRPAPEDSLTRWFERTVQSTPGGERRWVHAVVTDFEWYMLGIEINAGRIATSVTVTDGAGKVVYGGQRVTAVRVTFVDALLRAHVRDWLEDSAFAAALGATPQEVP